MIHSDGLYAADRAGVPPNVNTAANHDPAIMPLLDAAEGVASSVRGRVSNSRESMSRTPASACLAALLGD
jgi:hypothetical protein